MVNSLRKYLKPLAIVTEYRNNSLIMDLESELTRVWDADEMPVL